MLTGKFPDMKGYLWRLYFLVILAAMPLAASTARIYVMNEDAGTIDVIDPATNTVVQTIEGIKRPHGAAFAPDGSRAYITDEFEHSLVVVDTKTGAIIKKVPLSGSRANLPTI